MVRGLGKTAPMNWDNSPMSFRPPFDKVMTMMGVFNQNELCIVG
jgi:hypothetical protein